MDKIQLRLTMKQAQVLEDALAVYVETQPTVAAAYEARDLHIWLKYRFESFWGVDGTRRNPGGRPRQQQQQPTADSEAEQ